MKLRCLLAALAVSFALRAQKPPADNCAPPPSALAPTLPAKLLDGMGTVHLPITTSNPEAQKFFEQGVAQMHSFWAREAERSFLQAAALDSEAPMPWWGVAMVAAGDWRPRFQIDLVDGSAGRQADSGAVAGESPCGGAEGRRVEPSPREGERLGEDVYFGSGGAARCERA